LAIFKIKKYINSEDKKRLFSNFLSLSILQGANYILPLITLPYLVRVLGAEKFGLIAFAQAFIGYFIILTDYGFNLSATREISINRENKDKVSEIFSSVMIIKTGLLVLSFVIMSIIVFSFEKFKQDWLVYYLTFGMVVGQVLFPVWFFQGMERMKYLTILNILAKLIFTIAIFIFVHKASDYIYVPLINSLGFIVAGILALWIVFKDFKINFKLPSLMQIKQDLKEGWYIFVSTVGINLYRGTNTFILGIFTNNTIVGYYAVAEKILYVIQGLQNPAGQAFFPFISKKFSSISKSEAFNFLIKNLKYILPIYFFVFISTFMSSDLLIKLIDGNHFQNSVIDLKILSIIIIIGGLNYYFGIVGMVSLGFNKEFMRYVLIAGIFNILFSMIFVNLLEDKGVAISLVLSEFLLLIFLISKIKKILKDRLIYET